MEVTIISGIDPYTPKPGGTRAYVINLIQELIKAGINISLIGVMYNLNLVYTDNKYNFISIVKDKKISSYKFLFNLLLKAPFLHIPDLSIIHTQRPDDMLPFVLFFRKNPKIYTAHGRNYEGELVLKKGIIIGTIYEIIEAFVVKRVDRIIAVDAATKEFYINKFPQLQKKIAVIPVGINTTLFRPGNRDETRAKYHIDKNEKVILYVGRFTREKGLDLLLKSFKKVKKEIPDCKLLLVGDGIERGNLENLAKELGLEDVIFIDSLEHDKIPWIINCADVFTLCSLYEGMPTVVLEALACGVPVVSTDVGDVHKVVRDGETGYIVKTRTEEEMSDKLIKVLLSNNEKFKDNCIKTAQEYSWDLIAEKIVGVYNGVLEKE